MVATTLTLKDRAVHTPVGELFSYSVTEDSTPLNPADATGSVGQASISAVATNDSISFVGTDVVLADPARGRLQMEVKSVSVAGGRATFGTDSLLGRLNTERTMPPMMNVSLYYAFSQYLQLSGIGASMIAPDPIYLERMVSFPGWRGNVWDHVKMLNVAMRTETALIDGIIVLREPSERGMSLFSTASVGQTVSIENAAQTVEIYQYGTKVIQDAVIFEADSAYNVDVNGQTKTLLQLDSSLIGVSTPGPMSENMEPDIYDGGYRVSGSDGLPIPVQWWNDNGGKITTRITENPYEIEVTITGPTSDYLGKAPFRIAEGLEGYPALQIRGTGVAFDKKLITLRTGASAATTSTVVGVTVDNLFMTTKAQALTAGLEAACSFAGPKKTLTFSQKQYDKGEQEFGNIAGSMIGFGTSIYRVRSTTINSSSISGAAESRVTFADFNRVYGGVPFGRFRETLAGFQTTFGQQSINPLRNDLEL